MQFTVTPLVAVFAMVAILLVLGCFMDQVSMMLLTFPFFLPLTNALQLDVDSEACLLPDRQAASQPRNRVARRSY